MSIVGINQGNPLINFQRPKPNAGVISSLLMKRMDTDGDKLVSVEEESALIGSIKPDFQTADTDGDGFVSKEELIAKISERLGNLEQNENTATGETTGTQEPDTGDTVTGEETSAQETQVTESSSESASEESSTMETAILEFLEEESTPDPLDAEPVNGDAGTVPADETEASQTAGTTNITININFNEVRHSLRKNPDINRIKSLVNQVPPSAAKAKNSVELVAEILTQLGFSNLERDSFIATLKSTKLNISV